MLPSVGVADGVTRAEPGHRARTLDFRHWSLSTMTCVQHRAAGARLFTVVLIKNPNKQTTAQKAQP